MKMSSNLTYSDVLNLPDSEVLNLISASQVAVCVGNGVLVRVIVNFLVLTETLLVLFVRVEVTVIPITFIVLIFILFMPCVFRLTSIVLSIEFHFSLPKYLFGGVSRNYQFDALVVDLEVYDLKLLDFYVDVANPLIYVAYVLLLDILELVSVVRDVAIQQRQLELALVYLKVTIDEREGTPSCYVVFLCSLGTCPNQLEDQDV